MAKKIKPGRSRSKVLMVKTTYFLFGRALQFMSKHDPGIREEVARWPEDYVILYRVLPHGPQLAVQKTDSGHLAYRGTEINEDQADLVLSIKNIASALLVFGFKMSMGQAYAQNRVSVKGDISIAMSQMRILNILVTYMLPRKLVEKITVRVPEIQPAQKHLYRFLVFFVGIPFGI